MNKSEAIRELLGAKMKPAEIVSTLAGRGISVDKNLVKTVRWQLEKRKARGPTRAEIKVRTATILEQIAWHHISPEEAGRLIDDPLAKFVPKPRPEPRAEPKAKPNEPKAEPLSWDDPEKLLESLRVATGVERPTELAALLERLHEIRKEWPEISQARAIAKLGVRAIDEEWGTDEDEEEKERKRERSNDRRRR